MPAAGAVNAGVFSFDPTREEQEDLNIPHTRGFFLTNHLQWNIEFCLLNHMFDRKKNLDATFIHAPAKLQRRFVLVGIGNFVLMPFTLIFMIVCVKRFLTWVRACVRACACLCCCVCVCCVCVFAPVRARARAGK